MSWTKRVQHPSEVVRKGDDVSVLVLGVDPENKRISLGLKQTTEDPWDDIAQRFAPGVEADGNVVRLLEDGVVVDLGDDIEGFVPRGHIPMAEQKELHQLLAEGQTMGLRVLECDRANHRIVLAVTQMPEAPPPGTPAEPADTAPEPAGDEASAAEEAPSSTTAAASEDEERAASAEAPESTKAAVPEPEPTSPSESAEPEPSEPQGDAEESEPRL